MIILSENTKNLSSFYFQDSSSIKLSLFIMA